IPLGETELCLFLCRTLLWIFVIIQSVTCQVTVIPGFVGGQVVLPCVYKDPVPQKVFWRVDDVNPVFDIIDWKPSTASQISKYKDRVSSFPSEYSKGNFSLLLKDLRLDDANLYECKILDSNQPVVVQLRVSGQFKEQVQKVLIQFSCFIAVDRCKLHKTHLNRAPKLFIDKLQN
uniref:Ig-like domain-containing protein n=2 Tax=Poecilia TaxID=8080 RepID=A0A3B3YHS8_9TELE